VVIAGVDLVRGQGIGTLGAAIDRTVPREVGAEAGLTAGTVLAAVVVDEADLTVEIGIAVTAPTEAPNLVLAMLFRLLHRLEIECLLPMKFSSV
jgi:hypothetical protein